MTSHSTGPGSGRSNARPGRRFAKRSGPGERARGPRPLNQPGRAPRVRPPADHDRETTSTTTGPALGRTRTTTGPSRTKMTGRAAILLLVLAVLTVSFASSMRAYLQQRSHIADLKSSIAEREANINRLEREKARWDDPEFVKAQARSRFGYLMPGETGFELLGADGKPLSDSATLPGDEGAPAETPDAWWSAAWASVELAGNPPKPGSGPAVKIGQGSGERLGE